MSPTTLTPPSPSTIEYFYLEDLQKSQDYHLIQHLLEQFLFYAVNPYQTKTEKQLNWNNFIRIIKETTSALNALRRRLHAERSRPEVTFINPEHKDVSSLDYGNNTKKV